VIAWPRSTSRRSLMSGANPAGVVLSHCLDYFNEQSANGRESLLVTLPVFFPPCVLSSVDASATPLLRRCAISVVDAELERGAAPNAP
jgi:hypothetical protein